MADDLKVQVGGWGIGAHNRKWAIAAIIGWLATAGMAGFSIFATKKAEFYVQAPVAARLHAEGHLFGKSPGEREWKKLGGPVTGSTEGK
jgi:hypothetical protein